jgi:uncharacterized protein YndB with AHSA1/START domain
MAEENSGAKISCDREIVATRVFKAPRELVFEVWTDPMHIAKWWGPNGFTLTIHEMDVRPGGVWQFVMHGPDGVDYQNKNVYIEVVKPERIVFSHVSPPNFQMTATFARHGEKGAETKLTVRMLFETATERDKTIEKFGAIEGLNQTLGRLERELAKMAAEWFADREFVISRVFDASRELVFKAWTDPKQMAQWWGPDGFTNPVCELDVRPGGAWRIVMRGTDGSEYPAKGVYIEVSGHERLVMTIDHSDLPEEWHDMVNPNRPKGQGKPAIEGLLTVTFEDHGGKTKLTVRIRFESASIRDSMLKIGMNEGWSQSLERLTALLAP